MCESIQVCQDIIDLDLIIVQQRSTRLTHKKIDAPSSLFKQEIEKEGDENHLLAADTSQIDAGLGKFTKKQDTNKRKKPM